MTTIDWIIVAFTVLMAAVGWRQGFVAGALSLLGFLTGAFLGSRVGPALLPDGNHSPYAPLVALVGGIIGGSILAGLLEGAGFMLRRTIRLPGAAAVDGVLGAVLSGAIALGLAWIAGAVMLQTPGARQLRGDIQRSEILSRLNDVLPTGPVLNALARFDPFPRLEGPEVRVPPPRAAIARDPDVRSAGDSVVRITGTACGLGVEGSGWVARDGLVVTNAHVVAGQDDTVVQEHGEGPKLAAVAVAFDPHNDVAVLRVSGLGAPALEFSPDPAPGTPAAIEGYPENGPFDIRAARLGTTRTVISQDAYGRGPVTREMTTFRGVVRPGNSGGPIVDDAGRVLATVFAQARSAGQPGGYGVPNDIVRRRLADVAPPGQAVSTQSCAG